MTQENKDIQPQAEPHILHQAGAELQRIENQYVTKLYQVGKELSPEKLHLVGGKYSTTRIKIL
jgi:hypothetical protein